MERLTRSETYSHIKYTIGHTRWIFDKRDHSRLQEAFDELYDYQSIGSVEEFRTLREEGPEIVSERGGEDGAGGQKRRDGG